MKKIFLIITAILLVSCSSDSKNNVPHSEEQAKIDSRPDSSLVIGFSQMNHVNPWRVAETNDLKKKAAEYGIELIITDAESSQQKQIEDIKYLISQKPDYIILAPLVYSGWEEVFELCRNEEIPLIALDREVEGTAGTDFLTFVGGDFVQEAVIAAEWLAEQTKGQARIIELKGREGASCVEDREFGFHETIAGYEGMEIIHSEFADFERIKGQRVMEDIILSFGRDFNALYAHNDEMALGAIQALKAANIQPSKDVIVVSIDGSKDALKSIIAGELGATVECTPKLAEQVFQAIMRHKLNKSVPERIIVDTRFFDESNAIEYIDEAF